MMKKNGAAKIGAGCENSQVAKIRRLQKFATCEISQGAKIRNLRNFAGCENSHTANFFF